MTGLRVCFVVNSTSETSVPADIASALVKFTDCRVDVLSWFDAEPFETDDLVGVEALDAPGNAAGIDRRTVSRAWSILGGYDLVQVHHNHSGSVAKILARMKGVPVVSREGNLREGFTLKGHLANGLTNALAERVVPNSASVRDSFTWWERMLIPGDNIRVIPNGVDEDRIARGLALDWSVRNSRGIGQDTVLVSNAALLTEQKDHHVLVKAVANANEQSNRRIELAIAGDGPLESELRSLTENLGVTDKIHFLGRCSREKVYKLLSESDIYAMPSRWEGFSAAAVEALGVGVACVFSDIGPFRKPYDDVALFHPVDDDRLLAQQLSRLAENPSLRADLAARGEQLVRERYTMEAVARQYRSLYHEILG